jgi:hypothetical protein
MRKVGARLTMTETGPARSSIAWTSLPSTVARRWADPPESRVQWRYWGGFVAIAAACLLGEALVRAEERLGGWLGSAPTFLEPADRVR